MAGFEPKSFINLFLLAAILQLKLVRNTNQIFCRTDFVRISSYIDNLSTSPVLTSLEGALSKKDDEGK
jgi:hypothetical protein